MRCDNTMRRKSCDHPPSAQYHFINPKGMTMTRCKKCGYYKEDELTWTPQID